MSIQITLLEKPSGLKPAIHGMRNPKNSWDRSDSYETHVEDAHTGVTAPFEFFVGDKDLELMMALAKGGSVHAKYRRFINIYVDVEAPLYWWKEFDTYRVGEAPHPTDMEMNSCSTMHKITEKEFTRNDFACEYLLDETLVANVVMENGEKASQGVSALGVLNLTICLLNYYRQKFIETKDKIYWWQLIQLLPSSYIQKRTLMLNYETLANMYASRHDHKQDEWRLFCRFIEGLPYSEIITGDLPPVELPQPTEATKKRIDGKTLANNILVGRVNRLLKEGMKPKEIAEKVKQPTEKIREIIKTCKEADKRRKAIRDYHKKGTAVKDIAARYGISESTVRRILKEND